MLQIFLKNSQINLLEVENLKLLVEKNNTINNLVNELVQCNDKNRVSVILSIAGDGTKLPPLKFSKERQEKLQKKN